MTASPQVAPVTPYGVWRSPITAADVARNEALVEWVAFVGDEVWWTEAKPDEHGRSALVRHRDGVTAEALPPGWDVRTRVIEYGGRPWAPLGDGPAAGVVFTHWADQRVYRWAPGAEPVPISPRPALPAGEHYCDFAVRDGEVWCLRETRTGPEETAVRREIVALPLDGAAADDAAAVRILARSHHFMTSPKVSPDGRRVAWIGWNHPDMPWQSAELMCADVTPEGGLANPRRLAGGGRVSVGQVEWAPDEPDCLYAVTDPGGWWNVHRVALDGTLHNLCERAEEFGEPLWRLGARWFLPLGGRRFAVLHGTSSRELAVLEPDGTLTGVPSPYTEWANLATDGSAVAAAAASPRHRRTVVLTDLATGAARVLRPAETSHPDHLPRPAHEVYTGPGGREVHAYRYAPHNPDVTAPAGELPPYVVLVHGGPTNRSQMVVNYEIAFFTSRGIGIVDVQYGGSTGYGREYRERLDGNWGVVDVEDCAAVARGLAAAGIADPARIAIRGGSAGGWTAVASLAAEPDLYRAAAVYYPVLDAVEWRRRGTHDFESQYLDSLIGPWPDAEQAYVDQAPITRADRIRADFLLCQGLSDAICPPAQAQRLVDIARERGVGHRYLTFDGEGHGFRRTDTVTRCLEAELELYNQIFGMLSGERGAGDQVRNHDRRVALRAPAKGEHNSMTEAATEPARPVIVLVGGSGEIALGEDVAVQALVQARVRGMATCQTNQAATLEATPSVREQCDESWAVDFEDPPASAAWAAGRVAAGGRVDLVLGVREFAQVATAEIAAAAGAPGNPPDAVRTVRNKDLGRAALAAAGFPQPRVRLCETLAEAREFLAGTTGPWVVKPRDSQGSDGVRKVEAPAGLEDAVAAQESGKPFIVEEFVTGREFSVEGVFLGGRPLVLAVTEKQLMPAPLFVEAGHVLPARIPEALRADCASTTEAALTALGLRYGVFHVELWSTESGIVLGEVHVRNGGDWIHRMIQHAVPGLELFGVVYDDALGKPVDRGRLAATRGAAVRFVFPPPGVIRSVEGWDEVVAHPAVLHARLAVGAGDRVGPVLNSHDRLGEVVVGCDTPDEAETLARELVDSVKFLMAED